MRPFAFACAAIELENKEIEILETLERRSAAREVRRREITVKTSQLKPSLSQVVRRTDCYLLSLEVGTAGV